MSKEENLKNTLKEKFNFSDEELEVFIQKLMVQASQQQNSEKASTGARIWKKEEIERLGIKVEPVQWEKLPQA